MEALQLEGSTTSRQSFWAALSHVVLQTTILLLPTTILTSPLDSAPPMSYKRAIIWRSDDVFTL